MRLNCRKIATIAIRHHQATGPRNCCRVLVLSTSGYYRWKNATPSARSLRRSSLTTEVCGKHERSHGVYGSPRIHAQLCKRQIHVNVKTVTHIMNDANILAKTVKKWHPRTTQSTHTIAPVQMSSSAILPRVVPTKNGCATSLTSQPTKDFYISLALMDVWSRSHWDSHGIVMGWSIGQHTACDDCDRRADDGCEAQVSTDLVLFITVIAACNTHAAHIEIFLSSMA